MDGDTNTESEDQASGPVAVSFASLDALFLDTNFGELQNITGPNVMDQHTSHQSRRGDKNNVPSSSVISPLASATSGAISLVANPLSLPPSQVSSIGSHAIQSQASASAIAMQTATLGSSNSIPEFLYQLTKMLTDDNRDIIEWTKGRMAGILGAVRELANRILTPSFQARSRSTTHTNSNHKCYTNTFVIPSLRRSNDNSTTLVSESLRGRERWHRART